MNFWLFVEKESDKKPKQQHEESEQPDFKNEEYRQEKSDFHSFTQRFTSSKVVVNPTWSEVFQYTKKMHALLYWISLFPDILEPFNCRDISVIFAMFGCFSYGTIRRWYLKVICML